MSRTAAVISELAQHASGAATAALEPAALLERSKPLQASKWTVRQISSTLSATAHHPSWKRWVRQVNISARKRAYFYDPSHGTPKLTPNGNISRKVQRARKVAQLANGSADYKLEVSGPDVLVSTKLTRAQFSAIMTAIFPGSQS